MSTLSALLPARGRPGTTLVMSVERSLTPGDVVTAATFGPAAAAVPIIQRLKYSHHAAARLVAQGRSASQVSAATGYTQTRILDLIERDPAFQELVAYYADQMTEIDIEIGTQIRTKLLDITQSSLAEIDRRVSDEAGVRLIPIAELRRTAEMGMDRTVAPPKTAGANVVTPTHITFKIGTRDLRPGSDQGVGSPAVIEMEASHEQATESLAGDPASGDLSSRPGLGHRDPEDPED